MKHLHVLLASLAVVTALTISPRAQATCEPPSVSWGNFPSATQCVGGVRGFVQNQWGIVFPATGGHSPKDGCAATGACMYWVYQLPPASEFTPYAWGTETPQTYDIAVFPPSGSDVWGHVAVIDHVDGGTLWLMDDNWDGLHEKSCAWENHTGWVHSTTWVPYGFFRYNALVKTCAPHCDGATAVSANCGQTDCSASGQTCSEQGGAHCELPPKGYLDTTTCLTVGGWAQDGEDKNAEVTVDLVFGGKKGDPGVVDVPLTANAYRSDLCAAIGSCNHGFSLPTPRSLMDGGAHEVHAYATNTAGGSPTELSSSPTVVSCGPPAIVSPPTILRLVRTEASFASWKFSTFFDVVPMASVAAKSDPINAPFGPDLPLAPLLVQPDDGSAELWAIDSGVRRRVSGAASQTAWRFGAPTIWPAAEVYQTPQGADLLEAPLLIETEGPTTLLLDVPFLPVSGSGVMSGAGGGGGSGGHGGGGVGRPTAGAAGTSHSTVGAGGAGDDGSMTVGVAPADQESSGCSMSPRGTSRGALGLLSALGMFAFVARRRRRGLASNSRSLVLPGVALLLVSTACGSGSSDSTDPDESGTIKCSGAGGSCASSAAGAGGATSGNGGSATSPGAMQWAKGFVGSADRYSVSIASDEAGNVVVLGFFSGTINLGGEALSSEGMFSGDGNDWAIFVAKLDPTGAHVWSERFSGPGSAYPEAVALDPSGHVVLTGAFSGTLDFDGMSLTSAGGKDIFVVSLDGSGKPRWASAFGDAQDQKANALVLDGAGNITLVGDYAGVTNFGGNDLTSAGLTDVFVAQLDVSGKHRWSESFGDSSLQTASSVALDASANVLVTGGFQGAIDFGDGPLTSGGGLDVFVAKLDGYGGHLWSHGYGDAKDQLARSVAVDRSGNVGVTGELSGVLDFKVGGGSAGSGGVGGMAGASGNGGVSGGAGAAGIAGTGGTNAGGGGAPAVIAPGSLVSAGGLDIFVAKLDGNGETLWASSYGDQDDQRGWTLAFDGNGDALVSGDAPGTLDLGGGPLDDGHIFVASFDPSGVHRWSHRYGPGAGQGLSLSVAYPGSLPTSSVPSKGEGGIGGAAGSGGVAGGSGGTVSAGAAGSGGGKVMAGAGGSSQGGSSGGNGAGGSGKSGASGGGGKSEPPSPIDPMTEQLFLTGVFSDSVDFGGSSLDETGHTGPFLGRFAP